MEHELAGIGKKERAQLATVLKANSVVITPQAAARALKTEQAKAAQLLAHWCKKGWLSRVKRGVYVPVSLQSTTADVVVDEPWVLAKTLFQPCYIGGWSAAHHWDFTEQLFTKVMVFTSKKVPSRELNLKGASFTVRTVKAERLFGTKSIWLQNQKVDVSDPTKTIADAFNDPSVVGGVRMAVDILNRYMHAEHKNLSKLAEYVERMNNSAIAKRLGFIFEREFKSEHAFIDQMREFVKPGYSHLDPAVPGKSLVTAWGLWVPTSWKKGAASDHD